MSGSSTPSDPAGSRPLEAADILQHEERLGRLLQHWLRTKSNSTAHFHDAQDLIQKTIVNAYFNRHQYNPNYSTARSSSVNPSAPVCGAGHYDPDRPGHLFTWLRAIAWHCFNDMLRKQQRTTIAFVENADSPDVADDADLSDVPGDVIRAEDHERLRSAVDELPMSQRAIFELSFYTSMTGPQIAKALDIATKTVDSQLHAARSKLKKAFPEWKAIFKKTGSRKHVCGGNPVSAAADAPVGGDKGHPAVERPAFRLRWEDPSLKLKVLLRERDGHLIADAYCTDPGLLNRGAVSVGLVGTAEDGLIHKTIPLDEPVKAGCGGSADFGPLTTAVAELGSPLRLVVFLLV